MTSDVDLTCSDCGATFSFTEEEQERYSARGFAQPKRCPACRATRRAARKPQGGGGGGGGESRSRPRTGGGAPRRAGGSRPQQNARGSRSREPRQMYAITCANCGREAEVPFEPAPDRPAYCQECYRKQKKPSREY